jgi:hypothetical protein
MADELHHIERIGNTRANLKANLDILQLGIESDYDKGLAFVDGVGGYHVVAEISEDGNFLIDYEKYIGVGADKPRIFFSETNNTISFLDAFVGIGTDAPTDYLHIKKPLPRIFLECDTDGDYRAELLMYDFENNSLSIKKYNGSATGTFCGIDLANLTIIETSGTVDDLLIGCFGGGKIYFSTGTDDVDVTIDADGNVGIGTKTPDAKMHILMLSSIYSQGLLIGTASSDQCMGVWHDNSDQTHGYIDSRYDNASSDLSIRLRASGTPVVAVKCYGTGNVEHLAYTKLGGEEYLTIHTIAHTIIQADIDGGRVFTENHAVTVAKVRSISCTGVNGTYSTATNNPASVYFTWGETTATVLTVRFGNSFAVGDIISTTIIEAA